jgi:hypothetical protein
LSASALSVASQVNSGSSAAEVAVGGGLLVEQEVEHLDDAARPEVEGCDRIAERAFGQLEYDRFPLEYDTERTGGSPP